MLYVLHKLQIEKYIIANTWKEKSPDVYVLSVFCHTKVVQITFVYNQLKIVDNNLDWCFRVHIPELKEDTTIQDFFDIR